MLTGKKGNTHNNANVFGQKDKTFTERLAKWIRLNLFIPDARIDGMPMQLKQQKNHRTRAHRFDLFFFSSTQFTAYSTKNS